MEVGGLKVVVKFGQIKPPHWTFDQKCVWIAVLVCHLNLLFMDSIAVHYVINDP